MIPGVVLFALERELAPFRNNFSRVVRVPALACRTWECSRPGGNYWLVQGGMGSRAIANACTELLPLRPPFVVLAGFSGGLASGLRVGQLVLASAIRILSGYSCVPTYPISLPDAVEGEILTTDRVVSAPQHKRELHRQTGALAVDLESAVVAQCCRAAGIPFASLRVISDAVEDSLPGELEKFTDGERVRPVRLLGALMRRPSLLGDLIRLAAASRKAAHTLARGLKSALNC